MSSIEGLVQHMQFQWHRHETLSNNLANISTPGFKRDDVAIVPDHVAAQTRNANLLPLHGGGTILQWTEFAQGHLQGTGRTLDAAINGSGFFVVETPGGERFTRAGSFSVSPNGTLVGPTGFPILGQGGTITVASNKISIGAGGEVMDNGVIVDTLRVVDLPKPYRLVKEGAGLYALADPTVQPADATGYEIAGGTLEASNVATVQTMISMIDVLRTYEAAQRAMQSIEEANKHATSDIGKVS